NFSKYAIWLDRAFLRYDLPLDGKPLITAWAGRFENPFFSTRLIWDEDLGFDGGALKLQYEVLPGLTPFVTGGAFVVYNTDLNFSSNQPVKFKSYDKYLYGIQGGLEWKPTKDWKLKVAASYYSFQNIEGKLSTPYTPQTINDAGDTDNSRPSFAQKGNTYMAIRSIIPDASNDYGAINQWQYYGLATKFEDLALTARLDYNGFEPVQISLIGEFVQNLAFNKSAIDLIAVNNRGPVDVTQLNSIGAFEGSPTGWLMELRIGTPALSKRWDWSVDVGYRWIGSDSVVDGFTDSDFGLGGTNMKGFTVGAYLALSENVYVSLRWMGADSIAGPTYKSNIIQFDINSKF
ncbi:MAG: putative porin, partial [Verrucomicrobiae bacterium]